MLLLLPELYGISSSVDTIASAYGRCCSCWCRSVGGGVLLPTVFLVRQLAKEHREVKERFGNYFDTDIFHRSIP